MKNPVERDKFTNYAGPGAHVGVGLNTIRRRILENAAGMEIMRDRIITGLALAIGMLIVLIAGGWVFFSVILLGAAVSMWEYYQMLKKKGIKPMVWVGIPVGLGFIIMAFAGLMGDENWSRMFANGSTNIGAVISVYVFLVLIIQFVQIVQRKVKYGILDLSATVFGSIYIGAFGSFIFLIMNLAEMRFPDNLASQRLVMFLPMWAAWGSDVGAYFSGRFFGKTRLFPELSPKKTLEGHLGGLLAAILGYCVIALFVDIPVSHAVFLGLFAGAAGQIGDLSESALKREVGVKDSGTIFRSHGGFLDRIDSFLFTVPVVYHYLLWVNPWNF